MDYSREKIEVFEVDEQGSIIDNYLYDAYEINEAIDEGRLIIQQAWVDRLFIPKWDFESETWVEGLSKDEVDSREQEILEHQDKPSEIDLIKQENEMLAMAVMELSTHMMKGGK